MKPKKKTTKYVLIAIIILILAAFGLIDFRGLFRSKPQTTTDRPAVEIKKPETFVSEQKFEENKGDENPKVGNATVADAGPADAIAPQDAQPEKIKPSTQNDMAQADLESDNSVIQTPIEKQKPAISETDITAKDDAILAKSVDSAPSKATNDTPDKSKASDADITANQNADIFIIGEGPGPFPYSIQLASFNEDNHAVFKKSFQKFQKNGLAPFWVKVDLGGKGFWHRVLAGCFRQKSEAREMIRAKNLEGAIVADTKFAVRISEYKNEPALRQMITSLETKGYFPYVIKKAAAKYVLYVGAFYTRKVAQRTVDELTVQGLPSEAVLR